MRPWGDLSKKLPYIHKIFPKFEPIFWLEIALKPPNRHLIRLPVMIWLPVTIR